MNTHTPTTDGSNREELDARLTAYALGELSAAEQAEVERLLSDAAADSERLQVAEVRRLAETLRAARDVEPAGRSPDLRRAVIAACAAATGQPVEPTSHATSGRGLWRMLAVVAGGSLAAAGAFVVMQQRTESVGQRARQVAQLQPAEPAAAPAARELADEVLAKEAADAPRTDPPHVAFGKDAAGLSRLAGESTGKPQPTAAIAEAKPAAAAPATPATKQVEQSEKFAQQQGQARPVDQLAHGGGRGNAGDGKQAGGKQADSGYASLEAAVASREQARLAPPGPKGVVEQSKGVSPGLGPAAGGIAENGVRAKKAEAEQFAFSERRAAWAPTSGLVVEADKQRMDGTLRDRDASEFQKGDNSLRQRELKAVEEGRERYAAIVENRFLSPADHPLSTFSVDVDTASYANMRRFLMAGRLPPRDAVRIEELVNYFHYDLPQPDGAEPFSVTVEAADCPWRAGRTLVRVGLQGRDIDRRERPAGNLVFLVDVSGSMSAENKLPLVKQALAMLVEELTENDMVSIVTYAGDAGLRLPPTSGDQKGRIIAAIESLSAGGSTHGSAGIAMAYEQAAERYIKGGVNRVILATDGDLNVGVTSNEALVELVSTKAKGGTFLTVLGFGDGNLQDDKLEQIADRGNGIYAYIDGAREARKVLVEQLTGSTITIAKDVKIQVEFNPAQVASYRLLGYENRVMAAEDFRNDRKDAGDIGAGHSVTALYEVVTVGAAAGEPGAGAEPLKYQPQPEPVAVAKPAGPVSTELLTVKLRYKQPEGDTSVLRDVPLANRGGEFAAASKDLRFAAAVASFGMLLRGSEYKGDATFSSVAEMAAAALGTDAGGYRAEFLDLVRKARDAR